MKEGSGGTSFYFKMLRKEKEEIERILEGPDTAPGKPVLLTTLIMLPSIQTLVFVLSPFVAIDP